MSSFTVTPAAKPLLGAASIPGDKSIGHRALLFGALADGEVIISGLSEGKDNHRSRQAMADMGVSVKDLPTGQVVVQGVGLRGLRAPKGAIDCGNSGTTMRLLAGLLCAQSFDSQLVGDDSLSSRPMMRVASPLMEMGARIRGGAGKVANEMYPPLFIEGLGENRLRGISYQQPVASAQVKSAILLAGLYADGPTEVIEPARSRNHTELMLAHMGAPLRVEGETIRVDPRGWDGKLAGGSISVPGDPSSAAFILAAGLVAGVDRVAVRDVCVNPRRTGFLDVLAALGILVEMESLTEAGGDPVADLVITRGAADSMRATTVSGDLTVRSLDEIPILAVLAARGNGTTHFEDGEELRFKESDRIATTCEMLRRLGVEVEERKTGFSVEGLSGRAFAACEVEAHGDHRIAMSAVIAGLGAQGPVCVRDVDNVATSFPSFVHTLSSLGAELRVD